MQVVQSNEFMDVAISRKLYSKKTNLKFHLDFLFKNINFKGKSVLDVGGGKGLLSFYAAVKGANKVVCLEPECDGSSSGMNKEFNEIKYTLSSDLPVELKPVTLQEYIETAEDNAFDIVVMHNSINHLNEEACIHLLNDEKSYKTYIDIFSKVYKIMKEGGQLIITDCSSKNFFKDIGVKNFIVPTIEWQKHQEPRQWISLLEKTGFKNPRLEWKSPNSFGQMGRALMGNSIVSYLTSSHFKFVMDK